MLIWNLVGYFLVWLEDTSPSLITELVKKHCSHVNGSRRVKNIFLMLRMFLVRTMAAQRVVKGLMVGTYMQKPTIP